MQDAFRLGGWGMYPTTVIGLVLVITALHYAWRPARDAMVVVRRLSLLTMLSATLGFVTGCIKCFISIGDTETSWGTTKYIVVGVGESLNNLGLGLVLVTLASLCTVIGAFRARARGAELVDPRA